MTATGPKKVVLLERAKKLVHVWQHQKDLMKAEDKNRLREQMLHFAKDIQAENRVDRSGLPRVLLDMAEKIMSEFSPDNTEKYDEKTEHEDGDHKHKSHDDHKHLSLYMILQGVAIRAKLYDSTKDITTTTEQLLHRVLCDSSATRMLRQQLAEMCKHHKRQLKIQIFSTAIEFLINEYVTLINLVQHLNSQFLLGDKDVSELVDLVEVERREVHNMMASVVENESIPRQFLSKLSVRMVAISDLHNNIVFRKIQTAEIMDDVDWVQDAPLVH